jgi:hypothetical protein
MPKRTGKKLKVGVRRKPRTKVGVRRKKTTNMRKKTYA